MRTSLMVILLLALCLPDQVIASTYQWTDDRGVIHFTDDADRIPDRYLKRVREIETKESRKEPGLAPETQQPPPPVASPAPAAVPADTASAAPNADRERIAAELKDLEEELAEKRKELDRLRHKWSVAKGRTPTPEEVEEFEKKRAAGKATFEDNPYVNKRPLSSPVRARVAYYKMLEEVRADEERVNQLTRELRALGP